MALPTLVELVIPNFTSTTLLGVVLIAAGLLLAWGFAPLLRLLKGLGVDLTPVAVVLVGVGAVLVWVPSIFEDVWRTTEGAIIISGIVITLVVGFLLFWNPSSNKKNRRD